MWGKRESLAANDKDFSLCSKLSCERVWRFLVTVSKVPQHLIGVIGLDDEDRAVTGGEDGASIRNEDLFAADECADKAFLGETRFHE